MQADRVIGFEPCQAMTVERAEVAAHELARRKGVQP
jgi:hypothetical protein